MVEGELHKPSPYDILIDGPLLAIPVKRALNGLGEYEDEEVVSILATSLVTDRVIGMNRHDRTQYAKSTDIYVYASTRALASNLSVIITQEMAKLVQDGSSIDTWFENHAHWCRVIYSIYECGVQLLTTREVMSCDDMIRLVYAYVQKKGMRDQEHIPNFVAYDLMMTLKTCQSDLIQACCVRLANLPPFNPYSYIDEVFWP